MKLLTQEDAEFFVKCGAREFHYNSDSDLAAAARDTLTKAGIRLVPGPGATPLPSLSTADRLDLFYSSEAQQIKEEICDIGRRMWERNYTDANGGNISCRIGADEFICTPTLVSKGFMDPEMMCLVDSKGTQIAGSLRRSSEITTHMAVYAGAPQAKAVVHGHPIFATAFAMSGFQPPQCLIPELEVFVGQVPLAPYRTPGSPAMAEVIQPLAAKNQSIMMVNHGLICWGTGVEDAYFKMEITDAYCHTIVAASQIPSQRTTISGEEVKKLLNMKSSLGLPDPRMDQTPAQLAEVDPWTVLDGCSCSSVSSQLKTALQKLTQPELEALVKKIVSGLAQA